MIEQSLQELEQRLIQLDDNDALQHPLSELINHIKILDAKWSSTEQRVISFSFFDTLSEKLLGKERLVLPFKLKEIIDKTLSLLNREISVSDYNKFASDLQGHSSSEMKAMGTIMLSLAMISAVGAILAIAPAGVAILATISVTSLLLGGLFCSKSGQSSLSKEASNVAIAHEESSPCNYRYRISSPN